MFSRRARHGKSIYMFCVIFRDCVNMLKLEGNAREACDVLVTCTWEYVSCAYERAGNMSGNDILSIGGARGHTAVILGEVRMRVKMVQKCS